MRIKNVHIRGFKRFHDLTISELPETARLVVLTGPNGTGKSSLFDAFRVWQASIGALRTFTHDPLYYFKDGFPSPPNWTEQVNVTFHQDVPNSIEERKKLLYIRSAYRNEPDFTISGLSRMGSPLDIMRVPKLIDNDASVSDNYQRLVSATIADVYSGRFDTATVAMLRENHIGQVRAAMGRVFETLLLQGPGDPMQNGSFYFEKGTSHNFHYKNLSGGEKAAFDLLLDLIIKRISYDNTVFCIDEPETHMHTRLQARLLEELVRLIPDNCQLWVATHAIGMMRKARELQSANPDEVAFVDFYDHDFDQPVVLTPVQVDRNFWARTLNVALDDLAELVAPSRVVLCEGRPVGGRQSKAEFDAQCYRIIFAGEFPDTDFISVGNEAEVRTDQVGIGRTIQTLVRGTTVIRVVDQDDRTAEEVAELRKEGVRVLSRRHLESFLLDDDVLSKLCESVERPECLPQVLAAKNKAISDSVARGNPPDDVKSAAGLIYVAIKQILGLTQSGNTSDAFLRYTMAPLVRPDTRAYAELKHDLFGA